MDVLHGLHLSLGSVATPAAASQLRLGRPGANRTRLCATASRQSCGRDELASTRQVALAMASGNACGDGLSRAVGSRGSASQASDQQNYQSDCDHRSLQRLQLAAAATAAALLGASEKRLSSDGRVRRQIGGGWSGTARTNKRAFRSLASVARWADQGVNLATQGDTHSASRQTTVGCGQRELSSEDAAYLRQHFASGILFVDVRARGRG
jgi:hypothetical protein